MKIIKLTIFLGVFILQGFLVLSGQEKYRDYNEHLKTLRSLAENYQDLCRVTVAGKSSDGQDIVVVTLGAGDNENKPGIAVIAGIDNRYMAGSEIVTGFAERILKNQGNQEIKRLLGEVTFYLFPVINPDAFNQFFAPLRYERRGNGNHWDNDRDFMTDEDPFEDLNSDGFITMMRIEDPEGEWLVSEKDNRVMKIADPARGETGSWLLFTEGIDNDSDGLFNEDGPAGVNINNNFSFNYEEWGADAGLNAVSEAETKAVADFLFDHYNIYSVLIYGPDDNLARTWKPSPGGQGSQRSAPVTSILSEDEKINQLVSGMFLKSTGLTGVPEYKKEPGNIAEWAYFHYGRYAFATMGWWIAPSKELSTEENYLSWAEEKGEKLNYANWSQIDHPGFPGKRVEVGGIMPFSLTTPPESMLKAVIDSNYNFIVDLAKLHPDPELTDLKVEKIEKDIYRVSVKLHNRSVFATTNELGDRNSWNRKMVISIDAKNDISLLAGKKREIIDRLKGDETVTFSWIIKGKGEFSITAGAVNTGFSEIKAGLN